MCLDHCNVLNIMFAKMRKDMSIVIRKLTPALIEDYLFFFDNEDHDDNMDESKCYCVCWCSDDHRTSTDKMSSAKKRRELATQYVKNGMIQGYLAYHNGKVVGWCNANGKADCLNCISWIRNLRNVSKTETSEDVKVKSVFCFTIAPAMKRKGIATQLLERVCKDAVKDGFCFVESYPRSKLKQLDNFEGHKEMYIKYGFYVHEELDDMLVMRKQL